MPTFLYVTKFESECLLSVFSTQRTTGSYTAGLATRKLGCTRGRYINGNWARQITTNSTTPYKRRRASGFTREQNSHWPPHAAVSWATTTWYGVWE